jgi:transposase
MIGPAPGAKVMVTTRPVDFRKGADSLAALVAAEYGGKPYSGVICVFRAKRADRTKLIWWDGTGLCLMATRFEQGTFRWAADPGGRDAPDSRPAGRFRTVRTGIPYDHAGKLSQ